MSKPSVLGYPIQKFRRYLLDRLVLRPSRKPIEHPFKQRVMLSSRARPLECFVQRNHDEETSPEVLILKFPGTAGRAERSTSFPRELLPPLPASIWTWNPPGYGRSAGRASLGRMADASLDFLDQVLRREGSPTTPVMLCGNSLGCATTLHVAASQSRPPNQLGLVLRNPPPLVPVVKKIASRYPLGKLIDPIAESLCHRMNAVVTANGVLAPAVFLQSERDTLVPPDFQQFVIDAYAGRKQVVVMHGLTHGGVATESHEGEIREAMGWLWNQMTSLS
ncbi:MAG: lysophospholipase [Pirellulales bacterium]|nr:lysophospholipase [Pirellulales bacterium]